MMRIAIVNWTSRKVGGAEIYLDTIASQLERFGVSIAFVCEVDAPENRARISLPRDCPIWCVSTLGATSVLRLLRSWQPDLLYCQGLSSPALEREMVRLAPAMLFAHGYYGTCISGAKTWQFPSSRVCAKRFGWRCMLHYYPHRCGGLNPLTAVNQYRRQSARLETLRRYRGIIVASEHMRREYLGHGIAHNHIHKLPMPLPGRDGRLPDRQTYRHSLHGISKIRTELLFVGRMHHLKGGVLLLEALPIVSRYLRHPVRLVLAGDGPELLIWQKLAKKIEIGNPDIEIEFVGWRESEALVQMFESSDLLVVPSLCPETFGLIGLEGGIYGLPAAAFDVGGISEWLHDGQNGHLATDGRPTAAGLADTIAKCVADPIHYSDLCTGAVEIAQNFTVEQHIQSLIDLIKPTYHENSFASDGAVALRPL